MSFGKFVHKILFLWDVSPFIILFSLLFATHKILGSSSNNILLPVLPIGLTFAWMPIWVYGWGKETEYEDSLEPREGRAAYTTTTNRNTNRNSVVNTITSRQTHFHNSTKEEQERKIKSSLLLLKTVGEKNFEALENGNMIAIEASNGMVYGVNLDGKIAKYRKSLLFDEEKEYGRLQSQSIPMADCVASFYVWVRTSPEELERKWGCGTITFRDRTK